MAKAKVEADVNEAEAALESGRSLEASHFCQCGQAWCMDGLLACCAHELSGRDGKDAGGGQDGCLIAVSFTLLCLLPAAESAASKAQQEMERLQQQVATVEKQLEAAKEAATQRRAAEREVDSNLEDAKAQLQVGVKGVGQFWPDAPDSMHLSAAAAQTWGVRSTVHSTSQELLITVLITVTVLPMQFVVAAAVCCACVCRC